MSMPIILALQRLNASSGSESKNIQIDDPPKARRGEDFQSGGYVICFSDIFVISLELRKGGAPKMAVLLTWLPILSGLKVYWQLSTPSPPAC